MVVRRIGQILVDLGFITDEQLEVILDEQQQRPGALLGRIAEDMGLITDDQLAQALAEQLNMQTVQLSDVSLPPDVVEKVSETMAQMYRIAPLKFDGNVLTVATCDPQNLSMQDGIGNVGCVAGQQIDAPIAERFLDVVPATLGQFIRSELHKH